MPKTALLIGPPAALRTLERQLDLLERRPVTIGWVVTTDEGRESGDPIAGHVDQLEAIAARRPPAIALVTIPAVMKDQISAIRTRLRRLGVPDRFMPTLEDQLAGIGPRSYLDIESSALLDRAPRTIDAVAVRNVITARRVLITGAGGSIGSELARIVARFRPERLVLMDRSENALFEIDRQIARTNADLPRLAVLHDVVDTEGTLTVCRRQRPHVIFHAAAHKHVPMMEDHPLAAVDNNLFGTKSVADAADRAGTERFVMISTDKAVNPTSIMGATKRLAELYVQDLNQRSQTAYSMVRFGNVLGSSGSVLETWSKQIADGGPLTVTDPGMTRYFMTIPEAAALVIEAASLVDLTAPGGEVFVLDMGDPVRILDMAERFIRMHGLEPAARADDASRGATRGPGVMQIAITGRRPGEKLHETLAYDGECMQPTRHPDIHIWAIPPPGEGVVRDVLHGLGPELRNADPDTVAETIRRLVPEMSRGEAA